MAALLPGAAAVASVPQRPSVEGLLLYAGVTTLFLLTVPLLAAFDVLSGLARGVVAAVLPRVRFGAEESGLGVSRLGTAVGVFRGPPGLGGLLDDLRRRLARRGPPVAGGRYAI